MGSADVTLEPAVQGAGGVQACDHAVLRLLGAEPGRDGPRSGHDDSLLLQQLDARVVLRIAPRCRPGAPGEPRRRSRPRASPATIVSNSEPDF